MCQLSIVIITRNEEARIGSLLDLLAAQLDRLGKPIEAEIVVVDGASEDQTCAVVAGRANADDRIRLVALSNYGFSYQRNRGAEAARGEYVLYLSADVVPTATLLAKFAAEMGKGTDVVQGTALDFPGVLTGIQPLLCAFRGYVYEAGKARPTHDFSTVNVLVRRRLLLDLRFDETISALEDKELFLRLWGHARYARLRSAVVRHEYRESLSRFWRRLYREAIAVGVIAARNEHDAAGGAANFFGWIGLAVWHWAILLVSFATILVLTATPVVAAAGALGCVAVISLVWHANLLTRLQKWGVLGFVMWPVLALTLTTAVSLGVVSGYARPLWLRVLRQPLRRSVNRA